MTDCNYMAEFFPDYFLDFIPASLAGYGFFKTGIKGDRIFFQPDCHS